MSNTESDGEDHERNVSHAELKQHAEKQLQNAHEIYAYGLAIEDGELAPDEAKRLLEMDELAVVQSEYYPGDEYYDRASTALRRLL